MSERGMPNEARDLLRKLSLNPSQWPDSEMIVDLVMQGLIERQDMKWRITPSGERFLQFSN